MLSNQYFYITLPNEYACKMTQIFYLQLEWNTEHFCHMHTRKLHVHIKLTDGHWRWIQIVKFCLFLWYSITQLSDSSFLHLYCGLAGLLLYKLTHHDLMRCASYFSIRQSEPCSCHTGTLRCGNSPSWFWHGMLVSHLAAQNVIIAGIPF